MSASVSASVRARERVELGVSDRLARQQRASAGRETGTAWLALGAILTVSGRVWRYSGAHAGAANALWPISLSSRLAMGNTCNGLLQMLVFELVHGTRPSNAPPQTRYSHARAADASSAPEAQQQTSARPVPRRRCSARSPPPPSGRPRPAHPHPHASLHLHEQQQRGEASRRSPHQPRPQRKPSLRAPPRTTS